MERLLGIEPRSNGVEFHCIIHYTIDAKLVSPAGFEPVCLPVMSGALLPIKLETHKTHVYGGLLEIPLNHKIFDVKFSTT